MPPSNSCSGIKEREEISVLSPLSYTKSVISSVLDTLILADFRCLPVLSSTWKEKDGFFTQKPSGFFR